jgi:hypothetical protein
MTPHQKAIEAAWNVLIERGLALTRGEIEMAVSAYLASARESGWELRPREPKNIATSEGMKIWQALFDAAPRFEDAP